MSGLVFDAEQHRYWLDGAEVPSVTEIIRPLVDFSHVPPDVLDRKCALGTLVHEAACLIDEDDLDWSSVPDEAVGYLKAYERFLRQVKPLVLQSEQKLGSKLLRFAGTLDRVYTIAGKTTLVDLKSAAQHSPTWGVQLAGYEILLKEAGYDIDERASLRLLPDGTFRLFYFNDRADEVCFRSLLNVAHWSRSHA